MGNFLAKSFIKDMAKLYSKEITKKCRKYQMLKDLDFFVLDNSIRESTVGQLRGHTLSDKWKIYKEAKKCGFKNIIVASFSDMTRVDDVFVKELIESGEDPSGLYAFSEITAGVTNKIPDTDTIPVGLLKIQQLGLHNVILELDLSDDKYDFKLFQISKMLKLIQKWLIWCRDNLKNTSKVMVNFRDIPDVMKQNPDYILRAIQFLARLPKNIRPFGILYEEGKGLSTHEECVAWTKYIKHVMREHKWDAPLLFHIHEKFGYGDVNTLEVLMAGATGTWSSVCTEGAAMGNACTCVTILNLIRFGNTKVLKKYNCTYLRQAAINVTKITTGEEPHPKQIIYGQRALDMVLDMKKDDFDLADFFGEPAPVRISTMSTSAMIRAKLVDLFGDHAHFTNEQAVKMKEIMLEDLRNNRSEANLI